MSGLLKGRGKARIVKMTEHVREPNFTWLEMEVVLPIPNRQFARTGYDPKAKASYSLFYVEAVHGPSPRGGVHISVFSVKKEGSYTELRRGKLRNEVEALAKEAILNLSS